MTLCSPVVLSVWDSVTPALVRPDNAVPIVGGLSGFGANTAIVADGERLTYAELVHHVAKMARRLGFSRRLTLVAMSNTVESVVGYLAALAAGHAVILADARDEAGIEALIERFDPDTVTRPDRDVIKERHDDPAHDLHPDLALLLASTGSTGSTGSSDAGDTEGAAGSAGTAGSADSAGSAGTAGPADSAGSAGIAGPADSAGPAGTECSAGSADSEDSAGSEGSADSEGSTGSADSADSAGSGFSPARWVGTAGAVAGRSASTGATGLSAGAGGFGWSATLAPSGCMNFGLHQSVAAHGIRFFALLAIPPRSAVPARSPDNNRS